MRRSDPAGEPARARTVSVKAAGPSEYGARPLETEMDLLMAAVKAGDRDAFDGLVAGLRSRAFRIAFALVGSREDALDMTQEAFLKTYRARDRFSEGAPFLPWFHEILRNTCFSFLRKRGRARAVSTAGAAEEEEGDWELPADGPPPDSGAQGGELASAFWTAYRRLGAKDREILALRHFEELSYREIAAALSIPEGTVMSRLFHARRHLRERLDPALSGALSELGLEESGARPALAGEEAPR